MKSMMQTFVGLVLVVSLNAQAQLPEFTDLVDDVSPAVVNISTRSSQPTSRPQQTPDLQNLPPFFREFFERGVPMPPQEREGRSLGSGFIISKDGYVLTNNHVVEGAETVIVRLNDRREFIAEIVGTDPRSDVAVLKLDANDLPVAKIADSDDVKRGQWVVAIGSPFGFDYSVTAGIVSATGRALPDESYVPFIQTDVAINPGNSGGPIFNKYGEIVGLATGGVNREGVLKEEGIIISDISYGVTAERAVNFLNRPIQISSKSRYNYSSADLYKYMRSGVVFIVGQ